MSAAPPTSSIFAIVAVGATPIVAIVFGAEWCSFLGASKSGISSTATPAKAAPGRDRRRTGRAP